jgi:hypothetical protein
MHRILAEHGIPYIERCREWSWRHVPTWDGEKLNLPDTVDEPENVEFTIHEVAHFLVAPPESRKYPNYGLGPDPAGGERVEEVPNSWRGESALDDEIAVSLVDIWLLQRYGYESVVLSHKKNYGLNRYSGRDIRTCRKVLELTGLPADEIIDLYLSTESPSWTAQEG